MAKRLVLNSVTYVPFGVQGTLCQTWCGRVVCFPLKDISVSPLDAKFPVFLYTKGLAVGTRQCYSSCPSHPAMAMNY